MRIRCTRARRGGAAHHRGAPHRAQERQVVRLRDEFEALQRTIGYRFPRSRPPRARDDTTSRANERQRRRCRPVDGVSRRRPARVRRRRHAVPRLSAVRRGAKSKAKAAIVSTATLARQASGCSWGITCCWAAARRRPGAVASRRCWPHLRGTDCGDLSGRRHRHARAFIVRELTRWSRTCGATVWPADYKSARRRLLQARDLPLPDYRLVGTQGPDHRKLFEIAVRRPRRADRVGDGASKEKRSRRRRGRRWRNET